MTDKEPPGLGVSKWYFISFVRDKNGNEVLHPYAGCAHNHDHAYGSDRGRSCPDTLSEVDKQFLNCMSLTMRYMWDDYAIDDIKFSEEQLKKFERMIPVYYFWARAWGLLLWRGRR